jgi:4,5-dihydroxyphthalate decarboxylase
MAKLKLTMAIGHYDRYLPLFDGSVSPDAIDLTVLSVGQAEKLKHGADRNERMLQHKEFDVSETSLSSYLMAKARNVPLTAIPVFPRRQFSQSHIWIHANAGVAGPKDLVGKRVGLNTFQTTLSVLAKGDLQSEYGVPWREIKWYVSAEEPIEFEPLHGVSIQVIPHGKKMGAMLEAGEIDAAFVPRIPAPVLRGSTLIRRLFRDPKDEERRYFQKNGFFPIMHVIVFRDEVLAAHPWTARVIMDSFQQAKDMARRYYEDPNWSLLAWGRHLVEEEQRILGDDPWPFGIERNRNNLDRFMQYSVDQGLLPKKLALEEIFHPSTLDT